MDFRDGVGLYPPQPIKPFLAFVFSVKAHCGLILSAGCPSVDTIRRLRSLILDECYEQAEWGYNRALKIKRGVMGKLSLSKPIFIVFAFCAVAAIASPATTIFTSLVSFDVTNGSGPYYGSLVQGTDGNLYGTATYGGASEQNCYGESCGTVFKITPAGTLTTLHQFDFTDGGYPEAGLTQTTNGNFYGTASVGGSSGYGTIFKITPAGRLTTVYEFQNSTDGGNPLGALVQAHNGILYGTTSYGGATHAHAGQCLR
jgi:uncharacterized repeat protein (TIGR03803 family)